MTSKLTNWWKWYNRHGLNIWFLNSKRATKATCRSAFSRKGNEKSSKELNLITEDRLFSTEGSKIIVNKGRERRKGAKKCRKKLWFVRCDEIVQLWTLTRWTNRLNHPQANCNSHVNLDRTEHVSFALRSLGVNNSIPRKIINHACRSKKQRAHFRRLLTETMELLNRARLVLNCDSLR